MYRVPLGMGEVEFDLLPGMRGEVVEMRRQPTLADVPAAIDAALARPLGAPPLRDLARGRRDAVIVVTDATRLCPDHLLVPPMLRELQAAGLGPDRVTLLVAVGTHRASTPAEKVVKLGRDVVARYRVVDHDAADADNLVEVDPGREMPPFTINRLVAEADLLIATGVVEPHQYAGYSGGAKTVAIGTAGEPIIQYTHGPAFLDHPGTRLGRIAGNPFQQVVREVGRRVGLDFVINAVLDDQGQVVAVAAGDPFQVHDHLAAIGADLFTVPISRQYDVAVAGVGYPKDVNLYQASRAATYLQFAPTPVVRPGGAIVLPATCPEGPGEGAGERRFAEALREAPSPEALVERMRREGLRPGEQRAYIVASMLMTCRVIVAGAERPRRAPRAADLAGRPARGLTVVRGKPRDPRP